MLLTKNKSVINIMNYEDLGKCCHFLILVAKC